jgi:hypothetical protein
MTSIYLDPAMVPAQLRGSYRGTKFQAVLTEKTTIPASAGNWDGGSRSTYVALELKTGKAVSVSDQFSAPWDGSRVDREVTLQQGLVVVRHTISRGRDLGLTFYMNPADAVPMLPAPVDLTAHERIVLEATGSLKSSYMGRDRFQMAAEDRRLLDKHIPGERQITRAEWETAKAALIEKGLLNKAGAITVAGRNAIGGA